MKFFRGFVVFVDRPGISAAQLDGMRDDGGQHRWEVKSRAHRLADLVQGTEIIQRFAELPSPLLNPLFEGPVVILQFFFAFAQRRNELLDRTAHDVESAGQGSYLIAAACIDRRFQIPARYQSR